MGPVYGSIPAPNKKAEEVIKEASSPQRSEVGTPSVGGEEKELTVEQEAEEIQEVGPGRKEMVSTLVLAPTGVKWMNEWGERCSEWHEYGLWDLPIVVVMPFGQMLKRWRLWLGLTQWRAQVNICGQVFAPNS